MNKNIAKRLSKLIYDPEILISDRLEDGSPCLVEMKPKCEILSPCTYNFTERILVKCKFGWFKKLVTLIEKLVYKCMSFVQLGFIFRFVFKGLQVSFERVTTGIRYNTRLYFFGDLQLDLDTNMLSLKNLKYITSMKTEFLAKLRSQGRKLNFLQLFLFGVQGILFFNIVQWARYQYRHHQFRKKY